VPRLQHGDVGLSVGIVAVDSDKSLIYRPELSDMGSGGPTIHFAHGGPRQVYLIAPLSGAGAGPPDYNAMHLGTLNFRAFFKNRAQSPIFPAYLPWVSWL
jgi:hypothetical protein